MTDGQSRLDEGGPPATLLAPRPGAVAESPAGPDHGGAAPEAPGSPRFRRGRLPAGHFLRELPALFLVAAFVAFVLKTFVAQAFYIPSASMTPQLEVNDRVVVSKISYRLHEPRRGDLVVFRAPPDASLPSPARSPNPVARVVRGAAEALGMVQPSTDEFIKRVVALPGELVEGRAGLVYVDGMLLDEPYLPDGVVTGDFPPATVPEGHLWVMGDNRDNSADSRVFGPVPRDSVVGRSVFKVWPLSGASFL